MLENSPITEAEPETFLPHYIHEQLAVSNARLRARASAGDELLTSCHARERAIIEAERRRVHDCFRF